ncbi:hypothetical protein ACFQJ5_03860 [Halomicroarcula sp. GCM10025324]|uniref:DUF7344 domain-containing protein n=1 Tax=Haloarcula TaxID=2237 RepID=UPI0023E8BB7A|nr:hypothetical protein [Halomicroarcula sp. ZS-22-S1]
MGNTFSGDATPGIGSKPTVSNPDAISNAVLKLDHVHDALGHPRRRYLCYTLLEQTEWSLTDLATKIAAWEADVPEHEVGDDQRTAVYVSLYHTHVPNLVEREVVSYDPETETLSTAANTQQIISALEGIGASLNGTLETHARSEMDDESGR